MFRHLKRESVTTVFMRLQFAALTLNPNLIKLVSKLEKLQRFAVRIVPEVDRVSYEKRLKELILMTLEDRRTREDVIITYKIIRN